LAFVQRITFKGPRFSYPGGFYENEFDLNISTSEPVQKFTTPLMALTLYLEMNLHLNM
jgi:hypothetical protein